MAPMPPVFGTIAQSWDLDDRTTVRLWQAISSSHWSRPAALRLMLGAFHSTGMIGAKTLVHQLCSPRELVTTLEALVQEGRLPRRVASQVEERLLSYVDAQGRWLGSKVMPPERSVLDLYATVETYWR
jgi:hypothetical protein